MNIEHLLNRLTQLSRGTAFVKFSDISAADALLLKYEALARENAKSKKEGTSQDETELEDEEGIEDDDE